MIRAAFFRDNVPYVEVHIEENKRTAWSAFSAGEHLIDYLTATGVVEGQGTLGHTALRDSDVDFWARKCIDRNHNIDEMVSVLFYHLGESTFDPHNPKIFTPMGRGRHSELPSFT